MSYENDLKNIYQFRVHIFLKTMIKCAGKKQVYIYIYGYFYFILFFVLKW